ncbi:MAG: glycosyltransferase family 4 protein [Acidobacteriota bacterium]|nr:glycosyltransferase family 4 protein [Acidobacteriota bacterium]
MKIALIAPPFIAVPPADYGGTELFVAQLADGLQKNGAEVVVYANGESTVNVERRYRYERSQWPIKPGDEAWLKELDHTAWAIRDASQTCDVIHVQSPQALPLSQFTNVPMVLTLHGPHNPKFSELYARFPGVNYVAISEFQRLAEVVPRVRTIYHGIDLAQYSLHEQKQQYLSFIGRIAPIKGTHTAIEVAKRTGIPLKIAGDIQPAYREYFEAKVKPEIDGKLIEYVGLADLKAKNELLGNSLAMLFPIQWNEPFGLVMVEAMACGTPVLAFKGGSVPEIVRDGVSGYVCRSVRDMAKQVTTLQLDSRSIRQYVEENFSLEHMVSQYISLYHELQNAIPGKAA